MSGLRIKPVNGDVYEVYGEVTCRYFEGEKYYYCNDTSYPAEIVEEIWQ